MHSHEVSLGFTILSHSIQAGLERESLEMRSPKIVILVNTAVEHVYDHSPVDIVIQMISIPL